MRFNQLTGPIPYTLGRLTRLRFLYGNLIRDEQNEVLTKNLKEIVTQQALGANSSGIRSIAKSSPIVCTHLRCYVEM